MKRRRTAAAPRSEGECGRGADQYSPSPAPRQCGLGEALYSPSPAKRERGRGEGSPVALLVALSLVALARPAVAQDVPERQVTLAQKDGRLVASFDATGALDAAARRKLRSGIASQLVIRVVLTTEGRRDPVAFGAQTCRVAYDVWDEVFRVAITRPGSQRRLDLRTDREVVAACARVQGLVVARLAEIDARRSYRLLVLAELDPIDRRTLSAIRRWLAHPGGQSASERGGLFGSFASVFVNRRIGTSASALRFRSQRFRVHFEDAR